jgi:peptide/nickel transport system ATP-binding protein/oligopeptide transport system ATP-binding protein
LSNVLLDIQDLVVRFYTQEGVVYAVNNVSYQLHEGETLGVVGESGSGKSVHALAMMGLIPQPPGKIESGSVVFEGRDLLKLSNEQMRLVRGKEIAMIFQDPMTSLNPVLTIGTQLTETLKLHLGMNQSQANKRATELLDLVGIPDAHKRLKDYPHQFSGGMRQRVMIAIGLSCNPKLLIADEPTTALDVTIQAQILELVKQLKKEFNMAIIWITHDLGVVAELADTIQVMYAGRVVERGPTKSVFQDPRNAYTLGLMRSLPKIDGSRERLQQIEGSPPDMRIPPKGDPFAPRNRYATERCWEEIPPLLPVRDGDPNHYASAWYDLPSIIEQEKRSAKEGV